MSAIISGKVFYDSNHNGVYDSGESGIANVYVALYSNTSQSCVSTLADNDGNYSFTVNTAGNYVVYETVTNINSVCPPTNFTQPPGFTMSNGPRRLTISVTQAQINNNTTIGNNNFSHDTVNNAVDCTNSFIQFAGIPTNWYNINIVTGASVFYTALNPAHYVNAIGYNPLDDYIYGYDQTDNSIVRVDNSGNIITLKPNPPGLPLDGYTTGTFDANGFLYLFINDQTRYYVVDLRPNSATFMKLVNPTNGYVEQTSNFGVAMTPPVNISDWVYNPIDGNLYGVTNTGVLARIVPTTGVATNLTTTGGSGGASYGAQAIDANGNVYAINNQTGVVYKYTVSGNTATAVPFSSTVITSNNDGTICPRATISVDFGDAPDTSPGTGPNDYNTLLANNGPRHQILDGLRLGTFITGESDAHQNFDATGDDLSLGIQDDALTVPLAPLVPGDTSYSLAVTVTNNTGQNANLYGWIDINQNGIFEESESATAVVPSGGVQTINLVFAIPSNINITDHTFVRLRLTTDNLINNGVSAQDSRSVGPASDGEVEDYILNAAEVADLGVSKLAEPSPAVVGKELTFSIKVFNNGPGTALNVNVIDAIPVDLSNVEYSLDGGATFNPWPGSINIGDLLNNESRLIIIRGIVNSNVTGIIQNTVTVTSTTPDPDLNNNTDTVVVPVEEIADVSVVKVGSPKPVINGNELTYTITVSNAGPSDAKDVVINDVVPPELINSEYSLDNGATFNPWPGNLNVGSLPAGSVIILLIRGIVNSSALGNIQNTVTVTSSTPDPNLDNNTDTDDTPVESLADLALTKTASSGIVNPGELLTYTITITNNGPSDAVNVTLDDVIPANLLNPEYSLDGVNFTPWVSPQNLGNLVNGGIITVLIRGVVAPDGNVIINTATVNSDTPDPNLDNNTDTVIVGVAELADVAVTKVGSPNPVNNGGLLTYTIIVTNNGPSTAQDVLVEDNVPATVLNPEFSVDGGATFSPWVSPYNLGALLPGQTSQILIRGTVSGADNGTIQNTVTVTSSTPDPNLDNNTDTDIVGINAVADLAITKTASPSPVIAGQTITYSLTITNNGPSTSQNVILSDILENDIINPEYSLDGTNFSPWTNTLSLGNVAPGAVINVTIRGTVRPDTLNNSVSNTATVTSDTPDPDPTNNIDTEQTPIITEADLAVTKTSAPSPVTPGELLTYTITITNNGPSAAKEVSLIDTVPAVIINPEFSVDAGVSFNPWVSPYAVGNLAANQSLTILIRGTVSPSATGEIVNTAVVTSSTPDPNLDNNTDTNTVPVLESADILVEKNALTNPVNVGDVVTYSYVISNLGPSTSSSINLYDSLPAEILNPEISVDGGVTFVPFTNPFNIGDLAKGEALNVLIRGTLSDTDKTALNNTALIVSPTPDPDLSNNQDLEEVVIAPGTADVSVVKTAPLTESVGGMLTYRLTVANAGPSVAQNVVLTDVLPEGITNAQFSVDGGATFKPWPGNLNIGNLQVGQAIQVLIRGIVNFNVRGNLTNTATVTSDTPDSNPDNNTSRVTTIIVGCNICCCNQTCKTNKGK